MDLFDPTLLSPSNVPQIAAILRVLMARKPVSLKVTYQRGPAKVFNELELLPEDPADVTKGGIRAILPNQRGGSLTNSAQLGFVFKLQAFHFETNNDPVIERLGDNCFTITNRRSETGDENPVIEVVFSFGSLA